MGTHYFIIYFKIFNISFDTRTRSARELLRQIQAERFTNANPKLKITLNSVATLDPPEICFEFIDGHLQLFDSQKFKVHEMLDEIFLIANEMDIDYGFKKKSIIHDK